MPASSSISTIGSATSNTWANTTVCWSPITAPPAKFLPSRARKSDGSSLVVILKRRILPAERSALLPFRYKSHKLNLCDARHTQYCRASHRRPLRQATMVSRRQKGGAHMFRQGFFLLALVLSTLFFAKWDAGNRKSNHRR